MVRSTASSDLEMAPKWAAREGGFRTARCRLLLHGGRLGFFIGLLDEKPIGSLSAVCYGEESDFLGLYIVEPTHRDLARRAGIMGESHRAFNKR